MARNDEVGPEAGGLASPAPCCEGVARSSAADTTTRGGWPHRLRCVSEPLPLGADQAEALAAQAAGCHGALLVMSWWVKPSFSITAGGSSCPWSSRGLVRGQRATGAQAGGPGQSVAADVLTVGARTAVPQRSDLADRPVKRQRRIGMQALEVLEGDQTPTVRTGEDAHTNTPAAGASRSHDRPAPGATQATTD